MRKYVPKTLVPRPSIFVLFVCVFVCLFFWGGEEWGGSF